MQANHKSELAGSISAGNAHYPIQILIVYEWTKDSEGHAKGVRADSRWKRLRSITERVTEPFVKMVQKNPGQHPIQIRVNRLRGRHGMALIDALLDRIRKADIVIVDLGSETDENPNHNVFIELGMALYARKADSGSLFVLKPDNIKWPSDLEGFFYTEYESASTDSDKITLTDHLGFNAALRTRLREIAQDRGMFGDRDKASVQFDDDSSEAHS